MLLLLFRNAKAEDWSEQFTRCWDTFCTAIEHVAQVRCEFASTLQTVIVPETEAFTVKQERQVQKMIAGVFFSFSFECHGSENYNTVVDM